MIRRYFLKALVVAAAVTGGLAGTSSSAQAGMQLRLSDGVATTGTLTDAGNTITFSGTVGRYTITLTAGTSNSPGGPVNGRLEITNLSIGLNAANDAGSVGGTRVLSIDLSGNNFDFPVGSPSVLDSSGTVTFTASTAGLDNWSFRSWADGTNSGNFQAGAATPGVAIVSPGGNPGSLAANDAAIQFAHGPLYSLSSLTTVTLVSTNSTANTTGASVVTAVPVPAALVMALTGLPVLGLGTLVRRRRAAAAQ